MDEKTLQKSGGCMCGAVRFETTGEPSAVFHCHCHSCRKHTGAPMATLGVFKADQVKFSGDERGIHRSAPGVGRAFCANCGTPLSWETAHNTFGLVCALHVSTFDDPDTLIPSAHSFYPERIPWFDAADNLPRYEGFVIGGALVRHGPAIEDLPG